ncbi:hypothetical protein ACQR1W_03920 [Bradyrhizobium sp. HKCCYLS1011]|uniref:hypothetical protein n=1 Tax=Bradyrhizobium sp. HKCCYLS1011 TaxID=3420733 RepID=UPI003EB9F1B4
MIIALNIPVSRLTMKSQLRANGTVFGPGFQNRRGHPTVPHAFLDRVDHLMGNNRNVLRQVANVKSAPPASAICVPDRNLCAAGQQPEGVRINIGRKGFESK